MQTDQVSRSVICASFPETRLRPVRRDNLLHAIDMHFTGDCSVVSVDGPQGIGKTTLLANYTLTKPGFCIGIFARATSRITYDSQILFYDLCNQLSYHLDQKELAREDVVDETRYRTMLFYLQRRATQQGEHIYFVVDGIDEIPKEATHIQDYLIGLLPLGTSPFRFVLTNIDAFVTEAVTRTCNFKAYTVAPFSLQESAQFLQEYGLTEPVVQEIHRACKGFPGNLSSVSRLLETVADRTAVVSDVPTTLAGLYEKEWDAADTDDSVVCSLLACIAHLRTNHTLQELADLTGATPSAVQSRMAKLSFIAVNASTNEVAFVSEPFRIFAARKLSDLKSDVENRVVDLLLSKPDSVESQLELPAFLKEANREQDILVYLSPENIEKMIDVQQSYLAIQQQADIGIAAAVRLNQHTDLVKLCAYRSSLLEFCESSVWKSHVDCKIALGDYEGGLMLAHSDCMKEDRLQLLAAIAKAEKAAGRAVEQAVLDEMRSLCGQIDTADLGGRAVEIACDLLYTMPEVAIEMVEKRAEADAGENTIDWAFAKFSVEAALAGKGQNNSSASPLDIMSARVQDPKMRRFTEAAGVLFGDYNAAHAIAEAEKLTGAASRLFLLRQWAVANYDRDDAIDVIEYAVSSAIRATEYAPNARVFREIAYPLAYLPYSERVASVLNSIDSQKGNIERLGPTQEYVWVQLLLAQAEAKNDRCAAHERLVNAYLEICELQDVAVKADCLANFIAYLTRIDPEKATNEKEGLWTLSAKEFDESTTAILNMTGDHYHTMRRVVSNLARADVKYAAQVALKLNTEFRRDRALMDTIEGGSSIPLSEWQFGELLDVLAGIADADIRDDGFLHIVERIACSKQRDDLVGRFIKDLQEKICEIADSEQACRGICHVYNLLTELPPPLEETDDAKVLAILRDRWDSIDVAWVRIDTGFRISSSLAESNPAFAQQIATETENLRDTTVLHTEPSALAYVSCAKLAIRAFGGLLVGKQDTADDVESITATIEKIPSYGERAKLWSEVALRFWLSRRTAESAEIVNKRLKPSFSSIPPTDKYYRSAVLCHITPALYLTNSASTLDMLRLLPRQDRDACLHGVATVLLHRTSASDPYEAPQGTPYKIEYSDIEHLLSIARAMEEDSGVFRIITSIVDSIAKENHQYVSRQQREEIARALEEIARDKFPNPNFIAHEGYSIAAQAHIARLRKQTPQVWHQLAQSARSLPNTADSALVLGIVACCMKSKYANDRHTLLGEAEVLVRSIPSLYDRIEHLEDISEQLALIDPQQSKRIIREAMVAAMAYDGEEIDRIQRRLIDAAYRIDADFASSLASLADDDPTKHRQSREIHARLDVQKAKGLIADNKLPAVKNRREAREFSRSCWLYLGALNAGRTPLLSPNEQIRSMIQFASRSAISMAYPVFACIVESLARKYARTPDAAGFLRPVFSSFLLCARLAERIACKRLRTSNDTGRALAQSAASTGIYRPGDRDMAVEEMGKKIAGILDTRIWIADPYFCPDELSILQMIQQLNRSAEICILTSRKALDAANIKQPWSDAFLHSWHMLSDASPPITRIVVAAVEPDKTSPIHDRWIVTDKGGIRLGTSLNSLGITKISETSILTEQEALQRKNEIDRFVERRERVFNGKRVRYTEFDL